MNEKAIAQDFIRFVSVSPTAFQAVDECARQLRNVGYEALNECVEWKLLPGHSYYVTRNSSALIAFQLPREMDRPRFQIVAAHADSPTFKLKPHAAEGVCEHYIRLNVERYGGMIMSTWFDRPLSIAGRILLEDEEGLHSELYDAGRDLVLIPNMPIHFNREVNTGYSYNPQVDLLPLLSEGKDPEAFDHMLNEKGKLVAHDLFLYNRMPGRIWGLNEEFFSAPRIDDLECAYTALQGLLSCRSGHHVNVCAIFDNEEVGSGTKQGADSSFLLDVMGRIVGCSEKLPTAMAASFMVSADNAHAVHPNHTDQYDADNRVFMNEGIVIKHNANQKYTTDAVSDAVFSTICERAGKSAQHFTNRSDIAGGSTLGNISGSHCSMNTVDIGLAQLAMHSSYETAGVRDLAIMRDTLRCFYETEIQILSDGQIRL